MLLDGRIVGVGGDLRVGGVKWEPRALAREGWSRIADSFLSLFLFSPSELSMMDGCIR